MTEHRNKNKALAGSNVDHAAKTEKDIGVDEIFAVTVYG